MKRLPFPLNWPDFLRLRHDVPPELFPSLLSFVPLKKDMVDTLARRSGLTDGAVTRADTTRTRVNPSTGLIETMGANTAVFEAEGLSYNPASENLCFPSEPTVAQLGYSEGSRSDAVGFNAFERSIEVAGDGVVTSTYMYHGNLSASVGQVRSMSYFVEMLDGLGAPAIVDGTNSVNNDFVLVCQTTALGAPNRIKHITGNVYRIEYTHTLTAATGPAWGIYRYATNRQRPFRVGGFMFQNALATAAYIKTTSAAVSVGVDQYAWTLSDQLKNILSDAVGAATSEGTLIVDFVPGYSSAQKTANSAGIVSVTANVSSLIYDQATENNFSTYDGTNWSYFLAAHAVGITRRFALRFGYEVLGVAKMRLGYSDNGGAWEWGTETNYDGNFTLGTQLLVGHGHTYPFHLKNMRFFNAALTQAQIEANF